MIPDKPAVERLPESRLSKFAGFLKTGFRIAGFIWSLFKAINRLWELVQKFIDWLP